MSVTTTTTTTTGTGTGGTTDGPGHDGPGIVAGGRERRWPGEAVRALTAPRAAVGLACLAALAIRLVRIGGQSLWLDEAMSLHYADQGPVALWSWAAPLDPYHPPGYYSLLWLWTRAGHGEAWVRALSALAGAAAVPFVASTTRRIAGRRAAAVTVALVALSPEQVRFAQEARAYTLLVFEASVVLWSLSWLLRYPRLAGSPLRGNPAAVRWVAFIVAMAAALLSHNTSPLLLVTVNLAVVLHWRLTPGRSPALLWAWARANLAVLALWLVWLPAFVRQSQRTLEGGTSRRVPDPAALVRAARDLSLGHSDLANPWRLAADGAVLALLAGAVVAARRQPALTRWVATLAVLGAAGPTLAYLASVAGQPVFLTQSLLWASLPLYVLAGVAVARLPRPVGGGAGAAAAAAAAAAAVISYQAGAHKEPWRDASAYLGPRLRAGDLIVYSADYARHPLRYYLTPPPGVAELGTRYRPADLDDVRLELPDARRVWLVYAHEEFADPHRWVERVLRERGDVVEQRSWGAEIELLRFRPHATGIAP